MDAIMYCMDCRHFQSPPEDCDLKNSWLYCKKGHEMPAVVAGCYWIELWTKEEKAAKWQEMIDRDSTLAHLEQKCRSQR